MVDKMHELLHSWFGEVGTADLPNSDRTAFWFGEDDTVRRKVVQSYGFEYEAATTGALDEWAKTPRGRLALIILLDQFPRLMYRKSSEAFSHDYMAQQLSRDGVDKQMDHALTLIERVFFYMPLVHAENEKLQEQSIQLFQELVNLSLTETTQIYQLFLAYAYAHFRVIKEFGRFPQRNSLLGRTSTEAEMAFLKNT